MKTYRSGFTFVEVAVAGFTTFITVIVLIIFTSYIFQSYDFSFDTNRAISAAEDGLRRMTLDIREAKPSENGSYPLVTTNDQEFGFFADVDNDGIVEQVRYFLEGTDLKKGVIEPSGIPAQYLPETETVTILTDSVVNDTEPMFFYYNGNWPGDTQNNPLPQAQRLLETRLIKATIRVAPDNQPLPDAFELSTSIQLRNLKNNL